MTSELKGRGDNRTEDMSVHNELGESPVLGQYCWSEPAVSSELWRRRVKVSELVLLQSGLPTEYPQTMNLNRSPTTTIPVRCSGLGIWEKRDREDFALFLVRNAE